MTRLAAILALAFLAAQPPDDLPEFDAGTQAFRTLLAAQKYKPLESADEADNDPQHTIIILHSRRFMPGMRTGVSHWLPRFIDRGGALFIASDLPMDSLTLQLGFSITNFRLFGPDPERDRLALYRGTLIDCPLIKPVDRSPFATTLPFERFTKVAMNHPSTINTPDLGNVRGMIPKGCRVEWEGRRRVLSELESHAVAISGERGLGRYVAVADHSIFTNTMMTQPDNDNVAYAAAIMSWLNENGQRTKVLFVEEGTIRKEFDFDLDHITPPLPDPDVIGSAVDQLMENLEQQESFNKLFQEKVTTRTLMRTLLFLASIAVMLIALYFVASSRLRLERAAPLLPDAVHELAGTVPAEIGTAETDAREIAFRTLTGLGLASPSERDGTWRPRLMRLREIANGTATMPSAKLLAELIELDSAARRGELGPRSA